MEGEVIYFTVHDSVCVKHDDYEKAENIFIDLKKEYIANITDAFKFEVLDKFINK